MRRSFLALTLVAFAPIVAGLHGANVGSSLERVCLMTNAGTVEATTQASNNVPDDVPVASAAGSGTSEGFYGLASRFTRLTFEIGTPGVDNPASPGMASIDWFYWTWNEGQQVGAWVSLAPFITGTAPDFTSPGPGTLQFQKPTGWKENTAVSGCDGEYFFILSTTGNAYSSIPLANRITVG